MEDKLIFKTVGGSPFDPIQGYESDNVDLVGEERLIKFAENIPVGWTDQTSIENIHSYWKSTQKDYRFAREVIGNLATDFSSLTPNEKSIVAKWMAIWNIDGTIDYTTLIGYYMGLGYSQTEAQGKIINDEIEFLRPELTSCSPQRYRDAQKVCAMFLTPLDQDDIFTKIIIPLKNFQEMGILGLNYRSTVEGLMDFIDSTGSYSASGLEQQNYTLNFGTIELFKSSLKNALYFNKFEIS